LLTFTGYANLPTDPDSNRDIEDPDGNTLINYDEEVLYFGNMELVEVNEPLMPFDYNNNGCIDFIDVGILYLNII